MFLKSPTLDAEKDGGAATGAGMQPIPDWKRNRKIWLSEMGNPTK